MIDLNILIDQMATDISTQALQQDDLRLQLFLDWLNAHSCCVKSAMAPGQTLLQMDAILPRQADLEERLKSGLKIWLASLPLPGLLWEYRLILDEMTWWRDLDIHRLQMFLKSKAGR